MLEEIIEYLYEVYSEETTIVDEIKGRFEKVKKPVEELPDQLEARKRKLQVTLTSAKQMKEDTDEILRWLTKMEKALAQQKPISAEKDECLRQKNDHSYIQDEITRNEPRFDKYTNLGQDAVDGMEPGDDKEHLKEKVEEITTRWGEVKEKSKDRKEVLEDMVPQAVKYEETKARLLPWLNDVEKKLDGIDVILVDKEKILTQDATVRALVEEVKEHKDDYREIKDSSGELLLNCDRDIAPIKELVDDVKKRWTTVEETITSAAKKITEVKEGINHFEAAKAPVEEVCKAVERTLQESQPFGDDVTKGENEIEELKLLLEDMKGVEPKLFEIGEAGEELTKIEDKPDNVTIVRQQTDTITKKYDSLLNTLEEKIDKTEKVVGAGKKLKQIEEDVVEKTKALKRKTSKEEPAAADPKRIKEQLVEVEEWLKEAQEITLLCSEAELYGNEIIRFNKKDPVVEEAITERVKTLKDPMDEISAFLDNREKKLKEQLQECGAFQDQFDDFERRLKNLDERIEQQKDKPLSSKPARIAMTITEIDNIGKDFMEELQLYRNVQRAGKQVLDTLTTDTEWKQLKEKLEEMTKLWDTIDKKIDTEKEHVIKVKGMADEFVKKETEVTKWLDDNEKKLRELEPESCELEKLASQQKEINSVQSDIDHHKEHYSKLEVLIDELGDVCGEDVQEIHDTIENVKEKWDRVGTMLSDRRDNISDMQEKMRKFDDLFRPVKEKLQKIKGQLDGVSLMGADKKKVEKVLDTVKKLQKQVDDIEPKIDTIDQLTNEVQGRHVASDCKPLRDIVSELREGFDELLSAVNSKAENVEKVEKDLDELEDDVKKASDKIRDVAEKAEKSRPKKLVVDELQIQATGLQDVESELDEIKPVFDELTRRGRLMTEKGIGSEDFNTQLAAVENQYRELTSKLPKKVKEIDDLVKETKDFNSEYENAEKDIKAIEETFENEQPVGGDVETINSQMDELKETQSSIEILQEKVANLTEIQSTIKSKHANIDATEIDEALSDMNNRLLNANQKISDRKGKLEEAYVKCGKFKDALHSLVEWLEETQELVDGQRPMNVLDPNVLKAQIMEQKLLLRIFNDRASSVASLQATGKEIVETKDEKNKEIEADLEKVTKLWDSLNSYVNLRMTRMDTALTVSVQFAEQCDDVTKKIEETQAVVDDKEWKPYGEPRKITDQLNGLDSVKKKIRDIEPLMEDATKIAGELGELCTAEDRDKIRQKLQALYNQYGRLSDSFSNVSHKLRDAEEMAKEFYTLDDELNDWFVAVESKLHSKKPADSEAHEVKTLQKDFIAKKKDVENLNEMGQKLKKVVQDDDIQPITDIYETTTEKYDKLKSEIDQEARDLFLAKEKVDKFDEDVEELASWLGEISEKYRNIEPVAVGPEEVKQQMTEHQGMSADVAAHEPALKAVFDTGETLLMACNEEEEPTIKEKVDNLKYRHEEVKTKTAERQGQLVEALLLSQQFSDMEKEATLRFTRTEEYLKDIDESRAKGIEVQKEKLKGLQDGISHLRPLIVSLKETGNDLIKLSGPGRGSASIQERLDECDKRWEELNKGVDDKGIKIEETAQKTEEVQMKLEDLLAQFQTYKEDVKNMKPIAVTEEPIKEQIKEQEQSQMEIAALFEPVEKLDSAIKEIAKHDPQSTITTSMIAKMKKLNNAVVYVKKGTEERKAALEEGLDACQQFWPGLEKLKDTLMDVQHKIEVQGEPHYKPEAIEELQHAHEALRDELDSNEEVINTLCQVSPILVAKASQADKLDVHKKLSDVTDKWDSLESTWSKRKTELENAHDVSVQYHNDLKAIQEWLTNAERDLDTKSPVGTEVGVVKRQLNESREFYKDLVTRQIEITQLNQKSTALIDKVDHDDSDRIQEEMDEVKKRWDDLQSKSNDRQSHLEESLYHLGQFAVIIEEIIIWITTTVTVLNQKKPPLKDKKLIEVELEKLKVRRILVFSFHFLES